MGHDQQVGQASDQASDVVGQAGADSAGALRGEGTSRTAGDEWATRAANWQPPMRRRPQSNRCHSGRPVTIRATLTASTDLGQPRRVPLEASQ
jgi:hypothetical protein